MPDLAKLVVLDLARKKLFVDGVEFPWLISQEGPIFSALADPDDLRSVTLTFFTEDVRVIPEYDEHAHLASDTPQRHAEGFALGAE